MLVTTRSDELRSALGFGSPPQRAIALVPTMGALHEGHLSLVRRARTENQLLVVSIFVNPLQFSAGEDYQRYPRDSDADIALLEREGADIVFAPDPEGYVPAWHRTVVRVEGPLTSTLEGGVRPGHFEGVATIVAKLLSSVGPERAYFGEKDYQQLLVVRRMVHDLDIPTQIVACPIVRDADGLALSSRNAYLSPSQRQRALALPSALREAAAAWDGDADSARVLLHRRLQAASGISLDYAEVVDPMTLDPLGGIIDSPARALAAVRVGDTRLIDNVGLGQPEIQPRPADTEEL
ncbi:MAG TPA: pantoate--beta-alanine ligase [Egibacteraceae bacterium]|nr:pantoate--beta-alanine ligase [Egibacteraceae bacterium]